MKKEFDSDRLDVAAAAEAQAVLEGADALARYPRLSQETQGAAAEPAPIDWRAQCLLRSSAAGAPVPWLHLAASTRLSLICQRCLEPVELPLTVDRWFRFAADEAAAAAQDDLADEDVLVASREFDLRELIEDELLMALPVTPRHEACPNPVPLSAVDEDFTEAAATRPNPFAVLDKLRNPPPK